MDEDEDCDPGLLGGLGQVSRGGLHHVRRWSDHSRGYGVRRVEDIRLLAGGTAEICTLSSLTASWTWEGLGREEKEAC